MSAVFSESFFERLAQLMETLSRRCQRCHDPVQSWDDLTPMRSLWNGLVFFWCEPCTKKPTNPFRTDGDGGGG